MTRTSRVCLTGFLLGFLWTPLHGHDQSEAASEMATAAQRFLRSLDPAQSGLAEMPMESEQRFDWHFIPRPRKGLPLRDLRPFQRSLAFGLLASGLSQRGFVSATTIMSLEQVLYDLASPEGKSVRDPEGYFFTIFGTPGPNATWGWRVEGHHLSVNFTIAQGEHISATPSFFGSNPATVKSGPRAGLRTLADEEEFGRQLARSLTVKQRETAVLKIETPAEIITGANRKISRLEPSGIGWDALTNDQRDILRRLVLVYVQRHRPEVAEADIEKIEKSGWNTVHFVWVGGMEPGQGHYYRVQGETFLLEYDCTQDNANHVHAVYRDFEGDFGEDLLKEHYLSSHPNQ